MHWSGNDNTCAVLAAIETAAAAGAQLCLFPELAVTGFHRQIAAQAQPALVSGWMQAIEAACARHAIAASVGVPTFGDDPAKKIFNSQVFIDTRGQRLATVHKTGLTDPEATFFTRGDSLSDSRPVSGSVSRPVVTLLGQRISAVICREIEDLDAVCAQWAAEMTPAMPHAMPNPMPQIIVWPGLMSPDPDKPPTDPPWHVQDAQRLARRTGAFVLQANWPMSLNDPDRGAKTGASVVIGPDGNINFTLPEAAAGLGVFTLGATTFEWHADET